MENMFSLPGEFEQIEFELLAEQSEEELLAEQSEETMTLPRQNIPRTAIETLQHQ
jgi:hypothetical protein